VFVPSQTRCGRGGRGKKELHEECVRGGGEETLSYFGEKRTAALSLM